MLHSPIPIICAPCYNRIPFLSITIAIGVAGVTLCVYSVCFLVRYASLFLHIWHFILSSRFAFTRIDNEKKTLGPFRLLSALFFDTPPMISLRSRECRQPERGREYTNDKRIKLGGK